MRFYDTLACESIDFKEEVVNNIQLGLYGEMGTAQFMRGTFTWLKGLAIKDGFHIENLEIENPYAQILLAAYAFQNGYANHWVCYKTLTQK